MKISDIASKYSIREHDFLKFLQDNNLEYKSGFINDTVDDSRVAGYVQLYFEHEKKQEENAKEEQRAEELKQQALSQMLISSGFNFDGYKIVKYSGYISGDDVTQIPRGKDKFFSGTLGQNGENLTNALVKIRRQALKELKEAAYNLGCNAVIGVDFDYITLEPETASSSGGTIYEDYVICVTANGNAVVIEKE